MTKCPLNYSEPVKRLVAFGIDWYLSSLCVTAVLTAVGSIEKGSFSICSSVFGFSAAGAWISLALSLLIVSFYYYLPQLFSPKTHSGQSFGKLCLHIHVQKLNQKPYTFSSNVMRTLVGIVLVEQEFNFCAYVLRSVLTISSGSSLVSNILFYAGTIVSCISIFLLFKDPNHQMIHDKLAGTVVVNNSEIH